MIFAPRYRITETATSSASSTVEPFTSPLWAQPMFGMEPLRRLGAVFPPQRAKLAAWRKDRAERFPVVGCAENAVR